jgi:adenylate cyclase class 2
MADGLPGSGLRVRRERGQSRVTWKRKKKLAECEVNDEHEFAVYDGGMSGKSGEFEELLALLGLEKRIYKQKQGWVWQYRGITAELCEVSGSVHGEQAPEGARKGLTLKNLGWFLELEILAAEDSPETVAAAREQLLAFLGQTGIRKENIEDRYYSELLGDYS